MSDNSSTSSRYQPPYCFDSANTMSLSSALFVARLCTNTPVSVLVLLLCYQQWRRRRSFALMSHSDVFAFHQAVIHMMSNFGTVLFLCVQHTGWAALIRVPLYISSIVFPSELFLHVLTGVEHYVAVVRPVTYLALRQAGGVRIRNISVGCVWLLCSGWIGVIHVYYPRLPYIPFFCIFVLSLAAVTFCGLSVLCVLIRPGPGEVGGDNQHADQVKLRAFNTISTILAIQLLYFVAMVVALAVEHSSVFSYSTGCIILTSVTGLALVSSLVLPLLYLHRAGKLPCCRGNSR